MKLTGNQGDTMAAMENETGVVGGNGKTESTSSDIDSNSDDDSSISDSDCITNRNVNVVDVEPIASCVETTAITDRKGSSSTSSGFITGGTTTATGSSIGGGSNCMKAVAIDKAACHIQNSNRRGEIGGGGNFSKNCLTVSNTRGGGGGGEECQRSKSLPTRKKQVAGRANFGESGEVISDFEITTIREFTAEQSNTVGGVLRFCKRRVLFPYLKLLGLMGLKPLYSDGNDTCLVSLILSKVYLVLVALVLVMGYGLQFMTCFRRDHGFAYKPDFLSPPTSLTERSSSLSFNFPKIINSTSHPDFLKSNPPDDDQPDKWLVLENTICTGNVIYVYGIPSILHFISFLYMVYLYWANDDEHLQNLMERVFIQASHANINVFSQRRLIRRLQCLVCIGCIWIIIITSLQILQVYFHKVYLNFWIEVDSNATNAISALLLFATLWQDAIQVTIAISFAIQCHLICTYTVLIRSRLMQHSISLADCMKELGELGQLLSYLNEDLATGLAPLIIIDGIYASGAITHLIQHGKHIPVPSLIMLVVAVVLWIFIIVFPLSQAARVSTCCQNLKDMGHMIRIRPFGYQFVAQFDLDSFLLFVSNLNLKARILKVPITSPILSAFAIALSVSVLLWGYFQ